MLIFFAILLSCTAPSEPASQVSRIAEAACQHLLDCGVLEDTATAWCEDGVSDKILWTIETCSAGISLDDCEASIEHWTCEDLLDDVWPDPFICLSEGDYEG